MAHIVVIVSIVYRILLLFVKQQQTRNVTTTRQRREQQLYRRKRPVGYHAIYSGREKNCWTIKATCITHQNGSIFGIQSKNPVWRKWMDWESYFGPFFFKKKHKIWSSKVKEDKTERDNILYRVTKVGHGFTWRHVIFFNQIKPDLLERDSLYIFQTSCFFDRGISALSPNVLQFSKNC